MMPSLPIHGWDVFELVEDPSLLKASHPSEPHWVPRGGFIGEKPPTEEQVSHMRLQGTARMCVVRNRLEPETAAHFEFAELDELRAKGAG